MRRIAKLKVTKTSSRTIELRSFRLRARCPVCEREVEMLTSAEAALVLEIDGRTFDHFVAGGRIHAVQTVSGSIRVCKDSLFL